MKPSFTPFSKEALELGRSTYFVRTNGGISLPIAGFLYWLALGILGFYLKPETWCLTAFFTSGLIFPIGLALSRPFHSNIMLKAPLSGLVMPAMTAMFLSWPMTIAGYLTDTQLVPLFLAIGMSLHWPVIGWMYGSITCTFHAILRVALVTVLWFLEPTERFTLIPLLVSLLYLITVFGLKKEVAQRKRELGNALG